MRSLIDRYLAATKLVVGCLQDTYGIDNPLAAYWSGAIPQTGTLSSSEGGQYRFHGVGCYFTLGDIHIDVDFDPEGRADGFDAWRLLRFASETLSSDELDLDEVKAELSRACAGGELVRRGELYFLPGNLASVASTGNG
jgi:hypothetical protein